MRMFWNKKPSYSLTINVSGQGSTSPSAGTHKYSAGTVVNLVAIPATGWTFSAWNGPVSNPSAANTTVTMSKNVSVTAIFLAVQPTPVPTPPPPPPPPPPPTPIPLILPNDPLFQGYFQWDMTSISMPAAWAITKGSPDILVAIVDSGIDLSHPDLQGKVAASQDFSDSGDVMDHYGHGTGTGGIVGALTDNGVMVAGGGWNSRLINAKWAPNGTGGSSWMAEAIVWATDQGAKVINISAGAPFEMPDVLDAINYAWGKGCVIVAAAGNDGLPELFYPAAYPNVISVASNDSAGDLTPTSNKGSWIKCSAPGGNVWVLTNMDNPLQDQTFRGCMITGGTSIAAPHVSALAALLFSLKNDRDAVVAAILNNCDNVGVGGIGGGIVNAYKAVLSLK